MPQATGIRIKKDARTGDYAVIDRSMVVAWHSTRAAAMAHAKRLRAKRRAYQKPGVSGRRRVLDFPWSYKEHKAHK